MYQRYQHYTLTVTHCSEHKKHPLSGQIQVSPERIAIFSTQLTSMASPTKSILLMAEKHKNVPANSDIIINQVILISFEHAHWHVNEDLGARVERWHVCGHAERTCLYINSAVSVIAHACREEYHASLPCCSCVNSR